MNAAEAEAWRELVHGQNIVYDQALAQKKIADLKFALCEIRGYLREISGYVPANGDGGACLVALAKLIDEILPGETIIYSSDQGRTFPVVEVEDLS